jgi:hypothetical protein
MDTLKEFEENFPKMKMDSFSYSLDKGESLDKVLEAIKGVVVSFGFSVSCVGISIYFDSWVVVNGFRVLATLFAVVSFIIFSFLLEEVKTCITYRLPKRKQERVDRWINSVRRREEKSQRGS